MYSQMGLLTHHYKNDISFFTFLLDSQGVITYTDSIANKDRMCVIPSTKQWVERTNDNYMEGL
jgi:hypothetical protein